MSKIVWDQIGERLYETGVEKGVLYPVDNSKYSAGVPWNGLTGITEKPSGAESTALYADNIKYLNLMSNEEFGATIEAYTYPDEFAACDGSASLATGVVIKQQKRKSFGLSYVTKLGNDTDGADYGYKIHLIYGAMASPSEKNYATVNDSPEAITFSWEVTTTPVEVPGFKPTASIEIDSTKFTKDTIQKLKNLESLLYGADDFNTSKTYTVGEYVIYGEGETKKTYRCKTAISSAEAWNAEKWEVVGVAGPILPLPEDLIIIFGEIAG